MATAKQKRAARKNVRKAARSAKRRRTITHLPRKTRAALGKQGAKTASRSTGSASRGGQAAERIAASAAKGKGGVKPIPDGYHAVTPYLIVDGAAKLIEFAKQAFGAQEMHRMARPDGTIGHAELRIDDSRVMLADPREQWTPMASALYLYVNDADATYRRALAAGGASLMEPADQFYGDRTAGVKDPVGTTWWIGTHKEDVPPDELARRQDAFMKQQSGG